MDSLVGAAIGAGGALAAAVIGGIFTLRQVGAQRAAEARAAAEQRAAETLALNRAVLAEVSRLLEVLERHYGWWWKQVEARDTDVPLLPFTVDVYAALKEHLGRLDPEAVSKVVRFYGFVAFASAFQATQADHRARGRGDEFDERYEAIVFDILQRFGDAFAAELPRYAIPLPELNPARPRPHLFAARPAAIRMPPDSLSPPA